MKEYLLSVLEISKNYTLEVAKAMPDDKYNYRPSGDVWNFNELMNHIAYGIGWWENNYIKKTETPWDPPSNREAKSEVIAYLTESYNTLESTLRNTNVSDEVMKGFHATLDHITHHRGQAVIFLRSNGIAPPEYAY